MKNSPNWLLTLSAATYFAAAIPLLFAPEETSAVLGGSVAAGQIAILQVLGSALLGFALLNWSNRFSQLGGIFGRPLVLANLAHAMSAFLLLVRAAARDPGYLPVVLPTAVYLVLALAFASRLFFAPRPERE